MLGLLDFYRGKSVFVTGHTGFKGSWLCSILLQAGARVTGYALEPPTAPSLFELLGLDKKMRSVIGDVRDARHLSQTLLEAEPEIVFHLAAQPLVRRSYQEPAETFSSNIMGTVHLLDAVRQAGSVLAVVVITTDKVYENKGWNWGYRENDRLGGADPYSASKACAELVVQSYRLSFFADSRAGLATARAGNVIGGGDFSADRLLPDCVRAARGGEPVRLRNPQSVRPWQHVLEPLKGYLMLGKRLYEGDGACQSAFNFGPEQSDCIPAQALAGLFCRAWGESAACLAAPQDDAPPEAAILRLDHAKAVQVLGWRPAFTIRQAVELSVEWEQAADKVAVTRQQITRFFEDASERTARQRL